MYTLSTSIQHCAEVLAKATRQEKERKSTEEKGKNKTSFAGDMTTYIKNSKHTYMQ